MYTVYYILTIFLSDVLCANIKNNEQPSKWSDFQLKYSSYKHLIEYAEESNCFEPDNIHFDSYYEAITLGIESANFTNVTDLKNKSDFVNYQKTFKNNDTIKFCELFHDKLPKNSSFIKLTTDTDTCLTSCFCKTFLLKSNVPDKGCILLDYIYTKITAAAPAVSGDVAPIPAIATVAQTKNKVEEIVKKTEPQGQVLQKSTNIETTKNLEELKPNESKEEIKIVKQPLTLQQFKITKPEVNVDVRSETKPEANTPKQEIDETTEEKKTIEVVDQNLNILTNEDDVNGFLKTEKSTEQDKNNEMEDNYDEENLVNADNNIPKVEQSQFNINENEYPRKIISTVQDDTGSNFFTYLLMAMFLTIVFYVIYHNKTKILALILEGRRNKNGRGRRKHTASYSKLDSNLEEAISSPYSGRSSQIIY